MQEVNYTNTSIRHRSNTCTVLGTWLYTYTGTQFIRIQIQSQLQNKIQFDPTKQGNTK